MWKIQSIFKTRPSKSFWKCVRVLLIKLIKWNWFLLLSSQQSAGTSADHRNFLLLYRRNGSAPLAADWFYLLTSHCLHICCRFTLVISPAELGSRKITLFWWKKSSLLRDEAPSFEFADSFLFFQCQRRWMRRVIERIWFYRIVKKIDLVFKRILSVIVVARKICQFILYIF